MLGPNLLRYGHALKKDVLYWYEAGMKRDRNEKQDYVTGEVSGPFTTPSFSAMQQIHDN